jgi:hypothetical protein
MVVPHLLIGYGGIPLQLFDCLAGDEAPRLEATDADGE